MMKEKGLEFGLGTNIKVDIGRRGYGGVLHFGYRRES